MDTWQGPLFPKRRCSYGPDQGDRGPGLTPYPLPSLQGSGPQPQTLLASLFLALRTSPRRPPYPLNKTWWLSDRSRQF